MTKSSSRTVGCDLGDKYSHLCLLDKGGKVQERARVTTTQAGFRKWFSRRKAMTVVIEVGTHSRWVQRELAAMGHQVLVANARQVRLIYAGNRKNDRVDAEKLARLGRMDPKLLCPIEHRGTEAHSQLTVLRSRDRLVKARTELINYVRGVLKSFGLRVVKCESSTFARKAEPVVPDALAPALTPVLETLEQLNTQIRGYESQIAEMAEDSTEAQAILSIHGVGALTAMAFILSLERTERFACSRDVGPFLGLVPKERQTGASAPELRITKAGDSFVRKLLVNCAQYILGPHGKDSALRRYGERLKARGGKNMKKKAVIAVARKLAVLMHRLWQTGEVYEPLHGMADKAHATA